MVEDYCNEWRAESRIGNTWKGAIERETRSGCVAGQMLKAETHR